MVSITLSPVDHARLHDIHAVAGIALVEDDAAGRHLDGGAGALGKSAHVDIEALALAAAHVHLSPRNNRAM